MRRAASCCHPLQISFGPVGAWSSTSRKRVATVWILKKGKAGIVTGLARAYVRGYAVRRLTGRGATSTGGCGTTVLITVKQHLLRSLPALLYLFGGHADARAEVGAELVGFLTDQFGLGRLGSGLGGGGSAGLGASRRSRRRRSRDRRGSGSRDSGSGGR